MTVLIAQTPQDLIWRRHLKSYRSQVHLRVVPSSRALPFEPDPEEEEPAGSDVSTEMKQPEQLPERPKIGHGLFKGIVLYHGEGAVFNNVTINISHS